MIDIDEAVIDTLKNDTTSAKQEIVNEGPYSYAEVMAGYNCAVGDFLLAGKIAGIEDLRFIFRDKVNNDYNGKTSNFTLARTEYGKKDGISSCVEMQLIGNDAVVRAGMVYRTKFKDGSLFFETVSNNYLNSEVTLISDLNLGKFNFSSESVFTFDKANTVFIGNSFNAGYNVSDDMSLGFRLNTTHVKEEQKFKHAYNPGFYIRTRIK